MKFINTVEIGVGAPGPRLPVLAFHKLLQELGETGDNFASIADIVLSNPQVIHVTFTGSADADEFLRKHGGVSQHLMEGKPTQMVFKDPNMAEKFIRISDFPANANLDVVKTRLREFGSVLDIRRERYRASTDYFSCLTGVIVVRMSLLSAIPNYLQIGDYKTFVRYQGQPTTCRACNQPGHIGAHCPTRNQPAAGPQKKPGLPVLPTPPAVPPGPPPQATKSPTWAAPTVPPMTTDKNFPALGETQQRLPKGGNLPSVPVQKSVLPTPGFVADTPVVSTQLPTASPAVIAETQLTEESPSTAFSFLTPHPKDKRAPSQEVEDTPLDSDMEGDASESDSSFVDAADGSQSATAAEGADSLEYSSYVPPSGTVAVGVSTRKRTAHTGPYEKPPKRTVKPKAPKKNT